MAWLFPWTLFFLFWSFYPPSNAAGGDDGEARDRDIIRHDRRKERQHDRNISRAAPDKRCWAHTLNTAHVNLLTSLFRHTTESFMGTAVILNICSRIQFSFVYKRCMICVYLCLKSVCAVLGCQLMSCWSLEKLRLWNSEESSLQSRFQLSEKQRPCYLKITFHFTLRMFKILKSQPIQGKTLLIQQKQISVWRYNSWDRFTFQKNITVGRAGWYNLWSTSQ